MDELLTTGLRYQPYPQGLHIVCAISPPCEISQVELQMQFSQELCASFSQVKLEMWFWSKREEFSVLGFGSSHRQVSWALCRWRASPCKERKFWLSQKEKFWAKKLTSLPGGGLIVWRPEPSSHIFVIQNLYNGEYMYYRSCNCRP